MTRPFTPAATTLKPIVFICLWPHCADQVQIFGNMGEQTNNKQINVTIFAVISLSNRDVVGEASE